MSIQDESFPHDDDLEFSHDSGRNFVFPHHKPRRTQNVLSNKETNEKQRDISSSSPPENQDDSTQSSNDFCLSSETSGKTNASESSSPPENQDDSTQSSNDFCLSSETSGKTNASEPNDLRELGYKKPGFISHAQNKSVSYQDIHSEYTKRRYKHVESKVGQYIANIKALDEKRRNSNKFQRHSSMPETLQSRETTAPELMNDSKKLGLLRRSTNDLVRMHNHNDLQSDQDNDNYDHLTATTSSLSAKELPSENDMIVDKQTYEELLSVKDRNDYLQGKLEEKNAENFRLKQNLDVMRIEYSLCKDKLKQQSLLTQRFSGSFGSINVASTLGTTSLQSLLYPQETREKSTQTDKMLTPSPIPPENNKPSGEMYATPLTPDSNNNTFDHAAVGMFAPAGNRVPKTIATIQPLSLNFSHLVDQDLNGSNINTTMSFLRRRSNSLATRKKSTPLTGNLSKTSSAVSSGVPSSSSDSAIDIEVAESPKTQRQSRREEFIYYEQLSQRCAVVETSNAVNNDMDTEYNLAINNNTIDSDINSGSRKNRRKRHNLRSRMMRFFGACTKCKDHNMSIETVYSQHSQIPLLEKSTQNHCPNIR